MFKEEFPPDQDWLKNFCVRVDLGFLGIEKDYVCKELLLPNKKKKKRELSAEQKTENKLLASERIYVEHAIGGMKRYRILSDRLRIHDVELYNVILGLVFTWSLSSLLGSVKDQGLLVFEVFGEFRRIFEFTLRQTTCRR